MSKTKALEQIKSYLDNRAKEDELFAKMYKKPNKSMEECWNYIISEAKKRGDEVCMTDEEVYGLAVHYYCEDNIEVKPVSVEFTTRVSERVILTKTEKEKLKKEVEQEYKTKLMAEFESEKKEKAKKRAAKREDRTIGMGSLFDL